MNTPPKDHPMFSDWRIECNDKGICTITHEAPPRFTANWTSGRKAAVKLTGGCWTDRATGEDDIHFHGFKWIDRPPTRKEYRGLIQEAARAVDGWIASRV